MHSLIRVILPVAFRSPRKSPTAHSEAARNHLLATKTPEEIDALLSCIREPGVRTRLKHALLGNKNNL